MKKLEVIWSRWEKKKSKSAIVWMRRRKKTPANDDLRWSGEVIGKMGELREEDEVAHVRMPMTWQ